MPNFMNAVSSLYGLKLGEEFKVRVYDNCYFWFKFTQDGLSYSDNHTSCEVLSSILTGKVRLIRSPNSLNCESFRRNTMICVASMFGLRLGQGFKLFDYSLRDTWYFARDGLFNDGDYSFATNSIMLESLLTGRALIDELV